MELVGLRGKVEVARRGKDISVGESRQVARCHLHSWVPVRECPGQSRNDRSR